MSEAPHPGRLLVVDDDEAVCSLLQECLQAAGHRVRCAHGFEGVQQALAVEPCELAIVDIVLPGVGGIEVLRWLRQQHPHTAVLMVSAYDDLGQTIQAFRQGAIDYLAKPFHLGAVRQRVARGLERVRLEAANRAYRARLEELVAERSAELEAAQRRLRRQVRQFEALDRMVLLQMEPPASQEEARAAIVDAACHLTGARHAAFVEPGAAGESDLVARVWCSLVPQAGPDGGAACPVRYRGACLGVLQVEGVPAEDLEETLPGLERLGREAALLLRMVQVARCLEQEGAALEALLQGAAPAGPEPKDGA
ncbi:MAG: response regulator [Candidatus Latescibacterota bacterium]